MILVTDCEKLLSILMDCSALGSHTLADAFDMFTLVCSRMNPMFTDFDPMPIDFETTQYV